MDHIQLKHDIPEAVSNRRFNLNVCRLMYAWSFGKDIPNDMSFGDGLRDIWNNLNKDQGFLTRQNGVGDSMAEWIILCSPTEVYLKWADFGEQIVKEGLQAYKDEMKLAINTTEEQH